MWKLLFAVITLAACIISSVLTYTHWAPTAPAGPHHVFGLSIAALVTSVVLLLIQIYNFTTLTRISRKDVVEYR